MRDVFYFIWWIYETEPVIFSGLLFLLLITIVVACGGFYYAGKYVGKKEQKKADQVTIDRLLDDKRHLEEESIFGNMSERIATQYDVLSGNYEEEDPDEPIYN